MARIKNQSRKDEDQPAMSDADFFVGAEKHARSLDMDRNFWTADGNERIHGRPALTTETEDWRSWNRQGYQVSFEDHKISIIGTGFASDSNREPS